MVYVKLPLESREDLERRYRSLVPVYEKILEEIIKTIRASTRERKINVTVRHRVKDFSSWYAKLLRNVASVESGSTSVAITDVLGIRIVCPFLEEVKIVSSLLEDLFMVEEIDVKGADYAYHHFGYESVHFLVRIPMDFLPGEPLPADFLRSPVCEVQVRTILQEAWAEVEHELVYKSDFSPLDEPLKRKLAALNANLTLSDLMFQEIRDYQKKLHAALKQRRKDFYECIRREDKEQEFPAASRSESSEPDRSSSRETVDSLLLRGLLAHNDGKYADAVKIYSDILSRDIREDIRTMIFVHRGMAYFSSDRVDEALKDFNKALELNPANTIARYYRAVQARMNGKYAESFTDLNECLDLDPYNLEYLTARAETSKAAGDLPSAVSDCRTVLSIDPDFKPAKRLMNYLEGLGEGES